MTISHGVLDDYYDLHDRVMYPLTAQQEQKTRKDYGTKRGRDSISSSFAFGQPSSSHLNDNDSDGNDEGTSQMEAGFLLGNKSKAKHNKKDIGDSCKKAAPLLSDLARKVRNIDGKMLGKDGKPLHPIRSVAHPMVNIGFADPNMENVFNDLLGSSSNTNASQNASSLGNTSQHVRNSAVAIPMDAIDEINSRFVNTLYGFPVGKRLAFPMVENFVKYAWAKFGLNRAIMHHEWKPNTLIKKEIVSKVPLWVKMHNVPILTYSKGRSEYARALVEVSAEVPLVDSVDIDIPREDGKGYTTFIIRIEYEWQPSRCGTCKIFDHLKGVCPMKKKAGPMKKSERKTDVMKDKRHVHITGNKNKGKQVNTQRNIKGYHVNVPKTKLVYRAVVKPQDGNYVASNIEQSSDTTKKPSPSESSKEDEESVLEYIGNNDINGCTSREEQGDKDLTKKPSSSMEVLNEDSDTDVEEVFLPNDRTTFPSSSGGGGQ
uniref:DUF4283 domain-containing protein n=1 Tax=Tanacetum cinerariifolium TaxID=118510 RepID=A0A6L2JTC9_TANCI|nr:hypothetical protein [Tanacetum cinerariifolium]